MPISRCTSDQSWRDPRVAARGLHALGRHRQVGDQEQGAAGDLILMADDKNGRGLHVDSDRRVLGELAF